MRPLQAMRPARDDVSTATDIGHNGAVALVPRLYDTFLEPLVRGFREAGVRLVDPQPGMKVLDSGLSIFGVPSSFFLPDGIKTSGPSTQ